MQPDSRPGALGDECQETRIGSGRGRDDRWLGRLDKCEQTNEDESFARDENRVACHEKL